MNQESDSEHTAEPKAFPFSPDPYSTPGPKTVIHADRGGSAGGGEDSVSSLPTSSVLNRLFPPDPSSNEIPPCESPAGFELGHFTLESRIGIGGMGAVFRAVDERLQRPVALKVLSPHLSRDSHSVKRFLNEARAAAQLDHENIARVYYIGEDKGLSYIAFEYVTGTNVRDLIQQRGQLDPAEAVNYTLQIAAALRHTSAAGVVHRDIKPSNIIITPAGRAKLVDLGLARKETSEATGELTLAGTTLGTFDYISPEQAKDPRNVDVRSDIYSLGCTLYHMLTGVPPYAEGTVLQKLLDHQGKEPPDPRDRNRRVIPQLSAVVKKMMASDPGKRYATPDDLISDLLRIAGSLELRGIHPDGLIWTPAKSDRARFWERHLPWMATAAVLLLIVFLLERFPDIGRPPPTPRRTAGTTQNETRPIRDSDRVALAEKANTAPRAESPAHPAEGIGSGPEDAGPIGTQPLSDGRGQARSSKATTKHIRSPGESPSPPTEAQAPSPPGGNGASPPAPGEHSPPSIAADRSFPGETPSNRRSSALPVTGGPSPPAPPGRISEPLLAAAEAPKPVLDEPAVIGVPSEGGEPGSVPDVTRELPAISILGRTKAFPTLEAACAEAVDGDVIELRYNGARGEPEKPFRVANKKITIRAGKGFRPRIAFDPAQTTGDPFQTRMMTVTQGEMDFIDLDLSFAVGPSLDGEQGVLLSLEGLDQVRFQGVHVTLSNRNRAPAAVFELKAGPGRTLSDMKMMETATGGMRKEFGIRMVESFVHGECDLVAVKHTRAGRFDFQQSAIAVTGSLLSVLGDYEMPQENDDLELQAEHVTCLVGDSFIRMDSGSGGRNLLPVRVSSRNNVLAGGKAPLIAMTGNTNPEDFRKRLRWEGRKNFYDAFDVFWSISSSQLTAATAASDELDFEAWTALSDTDEVDANRNGIVWKHPWRARVAGFSTLTLDDLELLGDLELNPAVLAATDGTDVGANLSLLRRQRPSVAEEPPSE